MPAGSALESLVSRIRTNLHNRSLAIDSHGTSSRERACTSSFYSHNSIKSLKHRTQSRQAPKSSVCSCLPGNLAMGLSRVMARTRRQSQTNTERVKTNERRHRLRYLPDVFTRRRKEDAQTPTKTESIAKHHSDSTLPEYSQAPPLLVLNDQSESLGATPPPSINWHTRPSDVDGTPKAELILHPADSLWRRRTYATLDGASGIDWDAWANGRSISRFLGQVHDEVKDTATGPFWNRKYQKLNDAVTNVISINGASVNEVLGSARIGVREDTVDLSPLFVVRKKWKDFREELMGSPAA